MGVFRSLAEMALGRHGGASALTHRQGWRSDVRLPVKTPPKGQAVTVEPGHSAMVAELIGQAAPVVAKEVSAAMTEIGQSAARLWKVGSNPKDGISSLEFGLGYKLIGPTQFAATLRNDAGYALFVKAGEKNAAKTLLWDPGIKRLTVASKRIADGFK